MKSNPIAVHTKKWQKDAAFQYKKEKGKPGRMESNVEGQYDGGD